MRRLLSEPVLALLVLLGAAVAAMLAAPFGKPIVTHDSFMYFEAADALVRGAGLQLNAEVPQAGPIPLTVWAPLYPCLLWAVRSIGRLDVLQAASVIDFAALVLTVFLFYRLAAKRTGAPLAALLALLLAFEHAMLLAGALALSEAVLLPLPLLAIHFCERHFDDGRLRHALLAGLFGALCALTRHAGAIFAVVTPLALLLWSAGPWRRRLLVAASSAAVAGVLLLPYWARNIWLSGHMSGSDRGGAGSWARIGTDADLSWILFRKLGFGADAVLESLLLWPMIALSAYVALRLAVKRGPLLRGRLVLLPALYAAAYLAFFVYARASQSQVDSASLRMLNVLWPLVFLTGAGLLGVAMTLRGEALVRITVWLILGLRLVSNEEVLRHSRATADAQGVPAYMLTYGTHLNDFRPGAPLSEALLARIGPLPADAALFDDVRPHVVERLTGRRTYRWSAGTDCSALAAAGPRGVILIEDRFQASAAQRCAASTPGWSVRLIGP